MDSTMETNATGLRRNLYNILDRVIESGEPAVIHRKGHILTVAEKRANRLDRLDPHSITSGDDEALVHMDWSAEWRGGEF
jgi:hypothetical protein